MTRDLEYRVAKLERALKNEFLFSRALKSSAKQRYKIGKSESVKRKFENVQLNTFDCEMIVDLINDGLESAGNYIADYTDDNAEYGFLNIGIYANNKYLTEYNITAEEFDSFDITDENDRSVGNAASFKDTADLIVDHFKKNYV
jgi:hypothetical protein